MVSKKFVIRNGRGVDANQIAQMVRIANQYECEVYMELGQKRADAKSMMNMMALGIRTGDEIMIETNGTDEIYALNALEDYLCQHS